ncbi:MAG: SurA N-terminal domain-containing protein, partial [Desulfobacterales bacterium]|nr:SurA N-terminal domain-containing protein [Desulfobacterales bacterium]
MRDYATSWLIKIILGAIVVVFVFWGVGSFRDRKSNVIASVNGEAVSLEEYRSTYNNLLEQMRQRFGNNLNEEVLKMLQLDQQALDQLIEQRLLMQE